MPKYWPLTLLLIPILALVGYVGVAFAAKTFLVERGGSDKILITDGAAQYIIEHDYNCYDSDFYDGATIYIDTYYSPGYGDTIIIPDYSNTTCEVASSDEVNIRKYYVDDVFDSENKIIVTDSNGNKFLVEYGLGCGLSMWRYEGKTIDIDIGGSLLDGIGDQIYLFDSGRDCKVWDADGLSSGGSISSGISGSIESLLRSICPANSQYLNGQCVCNAGYVASGNTCVTATQNCQNKYGIHSYGDQSYCYCEEGYQLNQDNTYCAEILCPINSTRVGSSCSCNDGYLMRNSQCITYTQDCINTYGQNVYGLKGASNNSVCYCVEGYGWNSSMTGCAKPIQAIQPTQPQQPQVATATKTAPSPSKTQASLVPIGTKKDTALTPSSSTEEVKKESNDSNTTTTSKKSEPPKKERWYKGLFKKIFGIFKRSK